MSVKRLLDEARRFIQIQSVSQEGTEELVGYAESLLQMRGLQTKTQQVTHSLEGVSKRQFNLLGTLGDPLVDRKIRTGLLFVNHLDTCPPGDIKEWASTGLDPLAMTLKDGSVFGLGVASGKIDFLCRAQAIQKFRNRKLKMPVYLAGISGSELGMLGTTFLLQSHALNPRYVLVGEPTGGALMTATASLVLAKVSVQYSTIEKGVRGYNRKVILRSKGNAAHIARPQDGKNAIDQLIDFIKVCMDSGFELRMTKMDGGGIINQVPQGASAEIHLASHQLEDFKAFFNEFHLSTNQKDAFELELGTVGDSGIAFLPQELFACLLELRHEFGSISAEDRKSAVAYRLFQSTGRTELWVGASLAPHDAFDHLEARIKKVTKALCDQYPHLNIQFDRMREVPALKAQSDTWTETVQRVLESVGLPSEGQVFPSYSQAGIFAQKDCPTVVWGPGDLPKNVGLENEKIAIQDLEKALAFYEKLIEATCL